MKSLLALVNENERNSLESENHILNDVVVQFCACPVPRKTSLNRAVLSLWAGQSARACFGLRLGFLEYIF